MNLRKVVIFRCRNKGDAVHFQKHDFPSLHKTYKTLVTPPNEEEALEVHSISGQRTS